MVSVGWQHQDPQTRAEGHAPGRRPRLPSFIWFFRKREIRRSSSSLPVRPHQCPRYRKHTHGPSFPVLRSFRYLLHFKVKQSEECRSRDPPPCSVRPRWPGCGQADMAPGLEGKGCCGWSGRCSAGRCCALAAPLTSTPAGSALGHVFCTLGEDNRAL